MDISALNSENFLHQATYISNYTIDWYHENFTSLASMQLKDDKTYFKLIKAV